MVCVWYTFRATSVDGAPRGHNGKANRCSADLGVAEPIERSIAENQPVPPQPKVELAFYRKYTEAMLRRYLRLSMEVGRVPSLMGREMFRGHVSHYTMTNFEDGVVFCIDVERCLAKLRQHDQRLIQRIATSGLHARGGGSAARPQLRTVQSSATVRRSIG